ncbi:MAG: nuclear transport factor 2 family protein [Janthinobacterium lividum]
MTAAAQRFADRLQELEETGDVPAFVASVFSDDAELVRPELGHQNQGREGARMFWEQYLSFFDAIRSEFSRVSEGEPGVLEWTSSGRLRGGQDITYSGVSLLDLDGEGRVRRFATYYDTQAFHAEPSSTQTA